MLKSARAAITTGMGNPNAPSERGPLLIWLAGDHEAAIDVVERALSLYPSSAITHFHGAMVFAYSGHPERAILLARRALRLSPFDPLSPAAYEALGIAALDQSRYDEAAKHFERAVQINPSFHDRLLHAIALALADRIDEAKPIIERALRTQPNFRIGFIFKFGIAPAISDKLANGARALNLLP